MYLKISVKLQISLLCHKIWFSMPPNFSFERLFLNYVFPKLFRMLRGEYLGNPFGLLCCRELSALGWAISKPRLGHIWT